MALSRKAVAELKDLQRRLERELQKGARVTRKATKRVVRKAVRSVGKTLKRFARSPHHSSSDYVWIDTDDGKIYQLLETVRRSGGVTLLRIGLGREKPIYVPKMRFDRVFVPRKAMHHDRILMRSPASRRTARSPSQKLESGYAFVAKGDIAVHPRSGRANAIQNDDWDTRVITPDGHEYPIGQVRIDGTMHQVWWSPKLQANVAQVKRG